MPRHDAFTAEPTGHLPYEGITHIVDNGNLWVPQGVEFREGESEKFDYLYARHVFEHVVDPIAPVKEINHQSPYK